MNIVDAAVEGGAPALRPIVMTSLAFITGRAAAGRLGGAGAYRTPFDGASVVGGMIAATFIIPSSFPVLPSG